MNFFGFVLILVIIEFAESQPRRLRIKTVANIQTSTTPTIETNETTTVTIPSRRRQRLRTTTEVTSTTVEATTQRSRRRFIKSENTTNIESEEHGNRNSSQFADGQVAQSAQRLLVKPARNSSVYNFETGRVSVEKENLDDGEKEGTVVKPKRYSSRYKGEKETSTETGLLDDGDYREDSQGAYGEKVEEEEAPLAHNKEEQKKEGGTKETKGNGEEHHADQHTVKGNKDSKGYEGGHKFHKAEKGHHDKEQHKGEYKDEKGSKKAHKEGGGHFEAGHHGEKGEKAAEHAEKEEFKKGHSTRGGHVVHKKDEYEKKMEFYDESHEDGHGEKFGAHFESHGAKKGGHKKGGHKNGGSEGKHHAKKGHFAKGSHASDHKGHDKKEGKQGMYGHKEKYGKESSKKDAKKYDYSTHSGKPKKEQKKNLVEKEEIRELENNDDDDAEVEEVSETEPVKKLQEIRNQNVEYMNGDGPTAVIQSETKRHEPEEDGDGERNNHVGYFMTEDELLDNKEEAEALKVFDPVNHHHDDEDEPSASRGYRVAEPDPEEEPAQESQVHVITAYQPVQITARYRLPPKINDEPWD